MQVTLVSLGSRGDVQPFIALAVGLQNTGRYQVTIAAPDNFEPQVKDYKLNFFRLGIDTQKLLGTEGIDPKQNILLWLSKVLGSMKPLTERIAENTCLACQDAELIIYSMMGIAAYHVAEKIGIPSMMAIPIPGFAPTRAYPNPNGIFPALPLGGGYNKLSHIISLFLFQVFTGPIINHWRKNKLKLPAIPFGKYPYFQMNGHPQRIIGSYSPIISPKPDDWGENIQLTGYWFLDPPPDWLPPPKIMNFLEAGAPPVYIGFGSMANRTPRKMSQLVIDALAKTGQRGILAAGWGGLDSTFLPDTILALDSVPHTWLFPRMVAVVHHGGAGTTAAGLRAGVPSILIPHMGDQHFWAKRVEELGVGPHSLPMKRLTSERLADCINKAVNDQNIRLNAATLGEKIRQEDGIAQAIKFIERFRN